MSKTIFGIGIGAIALALLVLPLNAVKGMLQSIHPMLGSIAGYAGLPIKFVIGLIKAIPKVGDMIGKPLDSLYA